MSELTRFNMPETVKELIDTAIKTKTIDIFDLYCIADRCGDDWDALVSQLIEISYADSHVNRNKHIAICKAADAYYESQSN